MIICTNCNHQNPEGSVQCENCYAPLAQTYPCPHCGTFVQSNATFCGQCGYNLQSEEPFSVEESGENSLESLDENELNLLEDQDEVPTQTGDSPPKSPWDTQTREDEDFRLTSISALEPDPLSSDSFNSAQEIEKVEVEKEVEAVEDLEELVVAEEFSATTNSENDNLEPILDTSFDLALEEKLPEMSNIEELEATTARRSSEIPEIPEIPEISEPSPLDKLEVTNPDFDLASESPQELEVNTEEIEEIEAFGDSEELIVTAQFSFDKNAENDRLESNLDTDFDLALEEKLPEMSDIEELEETTAGLTSEMPEIAEPAPLEELESSAPNLNVESAAEMTGYLELEELEITTPDLNAESAAEITEPSTPIFSSQPINPVSESATQLQLQRILLSHVQTNTEIELSQNLDIIRIGKPNNQIPPDIDVSGYPDSNIVSRVHANIRVEGDAYFIEDLGSSNGTYINHKPLLTGNRHRLRCGDRISLGKGDLMTFIFKIID